MPSHLKFHSFTANTDHDFTGLVPNQLLKLNNTGTAIESFGTASTISLTSITNVDYIDFNTATTATVQTGRLIWNDADEIGGLELGMKGGSVTLQVGEENLVRVYNDDSVTLTNGMVVYVYSNQGNTLSVRRASSTGETTSARALGVVAESIPVGGRGYVNTTGLIRNLDTSAYSGGSPLYIGTTSGTFTDVKPTAPNHTCLIGFVSRVSPTVGSIFVHISNGWELEELHDVFAPHSALTQNNLLYWDTGNTRWQATGTSALGIVTTTGGTLNYVPKFKSGGIDLINSQIYDDGTNVGIGTASPSHKLHVNGNAFIPTNNVVYFATTNKFIQGTNAWNQGGSPSGDLGLLMYNSDGSNYYYVNGNSNDAHHWFQSVQNGQGVVKTDVIIRNTGRVGIGIINPSEKLHISGGTIRINTTNGTEGAGKLAVSDANGSISFSSTTNLGLGTVGGTGTAGKISKWATSTTLTDSLISETGTGVTVNGSIYIYGNVDVLGTASTFNTQTVQTADNNITMNLSGSHVSAYGGGITVLSGKVDNSSSTWIVDTNGAWSANTPGYFTGLRADSNGNTLSISNSAGTNTFLVRDDGVILAGNNTTWDGFSSVQFKKSGYIFQESSQGYKLNDSSGTGSFWGIQSPSSNLLTIERFGIGSSMMAFDSNLFRIGMFTTTPTAQLHLRNSTYTDSFRIQNTNGTDLFVDYSGNLGINNSTPAEKLHISGGTVRINTANGTEGAGKLAVSDANGSISFSSTTALGLITSAGTVNKYATTLTTPGANATNTITHNLGTTDITVTLWLVTTGDMTSAKITNRSLNSVDVIFSSAPGENVRVVVTG